MNEWKLWLSSGLIRNESLINQRTHNIMNTVLSAQILIARKEFWASSQDLKFDILVTSIHCWIENVCMNCCTKFQFCYIIHGHSYVIPSMACIFFHLMNFPWINQSIRAHHECGWSAGVDRLPVRKYLQITHPRIRINSFPRVLPDPGSSIRILQVPADYPPGQIKS